MFTRLLPLEMPSCCWCTNSVVFAVGVAVPNDGENAKDSSKLIATMMAATMILQPVVKVHKIFMAGESIVDRCTSSAVP